MSEEVHCECGKSFDSASGLGSHIDQASGDEHGIAADAGNVPEASLRDELNTILPGSDPLQNLHVEHTGGLAYRVLSARDGEPTYYSVELTGKPQCTCPDMEYNRDEDNHEACAHICAAMLGDRLPLEETAGQLMIEQMSRLNNAVEDAEAAADGLNDALVVARDAQAGAESGDVQESNSGQSDGGSGESWDTDAAAARLEDAFDEHLDDMQVETSGGHVWFQTGQDTEEEWPYPGGDEVFQVVTGPDCVKYVHDGSADWADSPHDLYDDKPGEWFKNALHPSDVEEYIAEVLE